MPMKPKLAALRRQVTKLLTKTPKDGQGAGWLALWKLEDWTALVQEGLPANTPCRREMARVYVLQKEAARFGIADDPAYVAALQGLREAMGRVTNPPAGTTWQGHQALQNALREASGKVAAFIFEAWGVPPGPLGEGPPGGRPPRGSATFPAE